LAEPAGNLADAGQYWAILGKVLKRTRRVGAQDEKSWYFTPRLAGFLPKFQGQEIGNA
jgi:hypothetical protein